MRGKRAPKNSILPLPKSDGRAGGGRKRDFKCAAGAQPPRCCVWPQFAERKSTFNSEDAGEREGVVENVKTKIKTVLEKE
jgi:hypothetical protein